MATDHILSAFIRLKGINATFDDLKTGEYVTLAEKFMRRAKTYRQQVGWGAGTPFFDVTAAYIEDIPEPILSGFNTWVENETERRLWVPSVGKVCRWHLKSKLLEGVSEELDARVKDYYEPLIKLLELGGVFQEHHGFVEIGNVGIPFAEPIPAED